MSTLLFAKCVHVHWLPVDVTGELNLEAFFSRLSIAVPFVPHLTDSVFLVAAIHTIASLHAQDVRVKSPLTKSINYAFPRKLSQRHL